MYLHIVFVTFFWCINISFILLLFLSSKIRLAFYFSGTISVFSLNLVQSLVLTQYIIFFINLVQSLVLAQFRAFMIFIPFWTSHNSDGFMYQSSFKYPLKSQLTNRWFSFYAFLILISWEILWWCYFLPLGLMSYYGKTSTWVKPFFIYSLALYFDILPSLYFLFKYKFRINQSYCSSRYAHLF